MEFFYAHGLKCDIHRNYNGLTCIVWWMPYKLWSRVIQLAHHCWTAGDEPSMVDIVPSKGQRNEATDSPIIFRSLACVLDLPMCHWNTNSKILLHWNHQRLLDQSNTYILMVTLWSSEELYTNRNVLSACSMIELTGIDVLNKFWRVCDAYRTASNQVIIIVHSSVQNDWVFVTRRLLISHSATENLLNATIDDIITILVKSKRENTRCLSTNCRD